MNLSIEIDKNSGVCGGVKRAIKIMEEHLHGQQNGNIYVNGELLHNRLEMERLIKLGLKVEEDVSHISNSILFVRTHGVGKKILLKAKHNENTIVDATCPKVSRSQKIIEDFYNKGLQIIIVGKVNHPEVQGLLGYCDQNAICIMHDEDLVRIDFSRKSAIIAQTTVSTRLFEHFVQIIKEKMGQENLEVANTICSFVENREKELIDFAGSHDVIIFIGGNNSSNTKVMFEKIKENIARAYLIENTAEIDFSWFKDGDSIGISGSASTPLWQIEEVRDSILQIAGTN